AVMLREEVEAAREEELRQAVALLEVGVDDLGAGAPGMARQGMADRPQLASLLPDADAEIGLLEIEEEPGIESAEFAEQRARHQQDRPAEPVRGERLRPREDRLPVLITPFPQRRQDQGSRRGHP